MAGELLAQIGARTTTAEWAFTRVQPGAGAVAAWIGNTYGMVVDAGGRVLTGPVSTANLSFVAGQVVLSDWSQFAVKVSQ